MRFGLFQRAAVPIVVICTFCWHHIFGHFKFAYKVPGSTCCVRFNMVCNKVRSSVQCNPGGTLRTKVKVQSVGVDVDLR